MQGLLLLNKPIDITSFFAVSAIKRKADEKRVGHTGTLDPMATGVLPVLLGRATTLSSFMLDSDKSYKASVKLGITTDTGDITGTVLSEKVVSVTEGELKNALARFTGSYMQYPPMYSAIKKDGVPLYKLARRGETAEIEPRKVNIYSLNLLQPLDSENIFQIDVKVSKGTYIRSLAEDIGTFLGCGATLTALCRTSSAGFTLDDCVQLDDINPDNITDFLLSEEVAVKHLTEVFVTEKQAVRFSNGGQLSFERLKNVNFTDGELVRVKYKNSFLGIGRADFEKKQLAVKCVINYPVF